MSQYGVQFDQSAEKWLVIENEHDRQHPDRGQCGGVGACSMMYAANVLEEEIMNALNDWRAERNR